MKHAKPICLALLLFLLSPVCALAAGTVSGKVTDLYTGEPIPGAKVLIEGTSLLTSTGKDGGYSIGNVPAGAVRVTCGAYSYDKQTKTINVNEGGVLVLNFVLEIGAVVESQEVVVKEKKPVVDKTPQTSADTFRIEELEDNAGAFEDVAKAMKKLPGVVQSTSFTADMYVRGAQNWENLILIDDFMLMNPYHFGIGFSIINTDLVDRVTFYRGGFPAKYPFATGSVLDVTYIDGNRERVDGEVNVSLLSAEGHLTGPIGEDFTWILSARRSYYDLMVNLLDYEDVPVPVFSDYLARVSWDAGKYNRFILFALRSQDAVRLLIEDENPTSVDEGEAFYTNLTQVYALSWQLFPASWFLSTTTLTHQIMNLDANLTADTPLFAHSQLNATYAHNLMEFEVHPRNLLTLGGDYGHLAIDLDSKIRISQWVMGSNIQSELAYFDTEFNHDAPVELAGGFVQDEWEIVKDKLFTNVGARFDYYWSDGQGWMISPRASLSWALVPTSILKAAWGLYYFPPFNILATDETWGNPDLRPQRAYHHVLGFEQGITENGLLRVETFFIWFDDLQFQQYDQDIATAEAVTGALSGKPIEADLNWSNSGYGKSYGIEVFAQKKLSGKWDGWLAYTLMEVLYNDGNGQYGWFHPYQDQRHTLNLVANYRPFDNWTFSGTFGLFSGKPYTPVDSFNKMFEGSIFQFWTPNQGALNSKRLPVYHKLDVRAERVWHVSERLDITGFLEVYNVYNHHNVFDYWYAEEEGIKEPVRKTIYDMPILPYFGVEFDF